jgi:hypothetical protein
MLYDMLSMPFFNDDRPHTNQLHRSSQLSELESHLCGVLMLRHAVDTIPKRDSAQLSRNLN